MINLKDSVVFESEEISLGSILVDGKLNAVTIRRRKYKCQKEYIKSKKTD